MADTYALDEVDHRLIELLQKNSRTSFVELGRILGLSEGAVRRRVRLLQERGVIKKLTIEVDRGYGVRAVTFLQLEAGASPRKVADMIAELPGVEKVYELTGRFDALAVISAPSITELNERIDRIRNIEGVRSTETAVILRVIG